MEEGVEGLQALIVHVCVHTPMFKQNLKEYRVLVMLILKYD